MTDPILRIPLSEAEAHRAELAAAKARIATLESAVAAAGEQMAALKADRDGLANDLTFEAEQKEADDTKVRLVLEAVAEAIFGHRASTGSLLSWREMLVDGAAALRAQLQPGITVQDIRELLLSEANEDSDAVRACLRGDDADAGDINVVDTICEMCSRIREFTAESAPPRPCGCGCTEDGEHWAVPASVSDSKGGNHCGFSTIERALVWVVEESAGQRFTDGRHPWDPKTFRAEVAKTPIKVDAKGFWSAAPDAPKAKAKEKAKAPKKAKVPSTLAMDLDGAPDEAGP